MYISCFYLKAFAEILTLFLLFKYTLHWQKIILTFLFYIFHIIIDIDYLKRVMPDTTDAEFFTFLKNLTTKDVTIRAIPEGTVVFAKVPLIRVEGPLAGI